MISSLLINFLLFWGVGALLEKYRVSSKYWAPFLKTVAFIALAWFVLTALSYLVTPLFFDHAESNIAAVAAVWLRGGSIYTALDAPQRYSLLYGPWPYIVAACFESLGSATIFLGKLPGVLNALLVLIGIYIAARFREAHKRDSLLIVGVTALALLGFYNYSYWNRPDSYLTVYVLWSVVVIEIFKKSSSSQLIVYGIIGVLMGLAMNCKVHGVFYFLPIAFYYLESSKSKLNILGLIIAAGLCLVAALGPFGLHNVSLLSYAEWLRMAAKHGLLLKEIVRNISFILSFLVLLYALGFTRNYWKTYIALCVSGLIIAVFAAKPGAGTHHFMPLVPVILFWAAATYGETDQLSKKRSSIIVSSFLIMLAIVAINHQKRIVALLSQTPQRIREFDDMKSIAEKNPGPLELGYTDMKQYESSFYKPWLIYHGRGLLVDGAALMDMAASDIAIPSSTVAIVKACSIPTMIFPKGKEPWSIPNLYDEKKFLISDEMRAAFAANYSLKEETEFFQVWKCK
ncbi:MAG TPA: hypothetical protein VF412_11635 [Bdellovibrio sp.]|uniref:hypothetical protein n=1 Tax=Bdellovibrio sp. TaxID=28201 RepID=UPI002EF264E0